MNLDLLRASPICNIKPPEGYAWTPPPINVAFQFCSRDYGQALRVLEWNRDLAIQKNNSIHLITDEGFRCNTAIQIANESWANVYLHHIKPCGLKWPLCNNHAFAETCKIMKGTGKPWLLWETDMIPSRIDWLQRLEEEYSQAKRPFMGAWMDCFDILNGGAIYPPDVMAWTPEWFSNPMANNLAYDCAIAPSIIWFSHPANHMMPNIFNSRPNGRPSGIVEKVPVWTKQMFDWVHTHHTCIIHRDKTGATIDFLRKKLSIN